MYNIVKCPVRTLRIRVYSSGSLETSIVRLCAVLGISLFFYFDSCHLTRSEVGREKEINANFTRKFLLPVLFTPPSSPEDRANFLLLVHLSSACEREKVAMSHALANICSVPSSGISFFPEFCRTKKIRPESLKRRKSGTAPSQKL